ncbi:ion channel [Glaciecola sp. 1036]|uniref:ion channel n=1 Tax=Alteromonadaceae TaxID=72275 RepID=UPI003D08D5DB
MEVISQLIVALIAIGLSTTSHFLSLRALKNRVVSSDLSAYLKLIAVVYGITFSQLIAAFWFAVGFVVSVEIGLGDLQGSTSLSFIEIYYFSLINLTTLGLAQLTPIGHLSFLSGLEAMTGFLLVSCSASLIFKTMNQS